MRIFYYFLNPHLVISPIILYNCDVTAFVFELKGTSAVIAFRLIILWLVFYFTVYNRTLIAASGQIRMAPFLWVIGAAILHLASNIFLLLDTKRTQKKNIFFGIFVFDVALISFVIYLTQGFESDLFLIYFLVIFMTVLARQTYATFTVAGLGCLIYGLMFLKSHGLGELLSSPIMIRFPLFLVAALFSHVISKDIERPEPQAGDAEASEAFRSPEEDITSGR